MSEPASPAPVPLLPASSEPVRVAVRRMRWFHRSFADQLAAISVETGVEFALHEDRLGDVFVRWVRRVEAQKPTQADARRDYVDFSAGLMLRELIVANPLEAVAQERAAPADAALTNPEDFWPEGFVYTVYCINIRAAVLAQEFGEDAAISPSFADIRNWWSFRENVSEDSAMALPFLDLFAGGDPNWTMPDVFAARRRAHLKSLGGGAGPLNKS